MADEFDNDPGFHEFARSIGVNTGQPPAKGPAAPAGDEFDSDPGFHEFAKGLGINTGGVKAPVNPKQNTGYLGDTATGLKRGIEQIPGMATGLADLAVSPISKVTGINRPFSRMADAAGEVTGFQPGKWSEQAADQYSPELKEQNQGLRDTKGFWNSAGYVASHPRVLSDLVAQSLPSSIAGGVVGKAAMGAVMGAEAMAANRLAVAAGSRAGATAEQIAASEAARVALTRSGAIAGGIGEGAVTAGQQMSQLDYDIDPLLAAGTSLAAGAVTGGIGAVSGRVANRLGVEDLQSALAAGTWRNGAASGAGAIPRGLAGRAGQIAGGALTEGVLEELPQSAQEQVWNNIANERPWNENVAEAAAQGMMAGMGMGAGFNLGGSMRSGAKDILNKPKAESPGKKMADGKTSRFAEDLSPVTLEQQRMEEAAAMNQTYDEATAQFNDLTRTGTDLLNLGEAAYKQGAVENSQQELAARGMTPTEEVVDDENPNPGTPTTAANIAGNLDISQKEVLAPEDEAAMASNEEAIASEARLADLNTQYSKLDETAKALEERAAKKGSRKTTRQQAVEARAKANVLQTQIAATTPAEAPVQSVASQQALDAAKPAPTAAPAVPPGLAKVKEVKAKKEAAKAAKEAPAPAVEITAEDIDRAIKSLESAEKSADGAPLSGKVGKADQPWLLSVARALAGGKFNKDTGEVEHRKPVIYKEGSMADIDTEAMGIHGDKIHAVLNAIVKLQNAAKAVYNNTSNIIPTEKRIAQDLTVAEAKTYADKQSYKDEANRLALQQSINDLVEAAGSEKAVEAIVAVYKARVQAVKTKITGTAKFHVKTDFLLSRSWSDSKTGALKSGDIVREGEIRNSKELQARGVENSPIRGAAEEGSARRPATAGSDQTNNPVEFGLAGVINYLQLHGTGFEGLLSSALGRAFRGAKTMPKLEFIEDGAKAKYDPNTDTVYLHENASASEVLHEALHAALQWRVYNGWGKDKSVEALRLSLKQVLASTTEAQNFGNAGKVLEILKGLSEQDAVLELVSYGATMKDFRDLLKSLEVADKEATKTTMSRMQSVWRALTSLVQKLLGVSGKVANDVLGHTISMLNDATLAQNARPGGSQGTVLEQATASLHQDNPTGAYDYSKNAQTTALFSQLFKGYSVQKLQQFAKTKIASALRLAFGNTEAGKARAELWANRAVHLGKYMQDWAKPAAAVFSWFNSSINIHDIIAGAIRGAKNMRGIPIGTVTNFTARLETMKTEDALKAIGYLNGTNDATGLNSHVKEAIDELITARNNLLEQYRTSVGEDKVYEFLKNQPLMDSLIYVVDDKLSADSITGRSYGAHNMDRVLGKVTEKTFIDNVFAPAAGEDAKDLSGTFYKFKLAESAVQSDVWGFVDSSMVNDPAVQAAMKPGESVKTDLAYRMGKVKKKGDTKVVGFIGKQDYKQMLAAGKNAEVGGAILNTVNLISNAVSATWLARTLDQYGHGGEVNGEKMRTYVYDDKKAFENPETGEGEGHRLLQWSDANDRSASIQNIYRHPDAWVQVPKSAAYGLLSGKIIRGPEWMAVQDAYNRKSVIDLPFLNNVMRWFKQAKTIWNPSTHITNALTNVTLAHLHNISAATEWEAATAYKNFMVSPEKMTAEQKQLMKDFMASGASIADYSTSELRAIVYDAIKATVHDSETMGDRFKAAIAARSQAAAAAVDWATKKGKDVHKAVADTYAAGDNTFRLAAFMTKMGDLQKSGKSYEEAVREAGLFAQDAFLNYDIDARAAQILKQTALPFVSWTYAVTPVLAKIAVQQPWKLASLGLLFSAASMLLSAAAGGDDDDETRKREKMDEKLFGTFGPYNNMRLPFLDRDGKKAYVNVGKYIPNPFSFKEQPNGFMGLKRFPSSLTPNGPLFAFAYGIAGVDPYTGQKLYDNADSSWERFGKSAKYMTKQIVLPPVVDQVLPSGDSNLPKILQHGVTGKAPDALNVASKLVGLPTRMVDPTEVAKTAQLGMKSIDRDTSEAVGKVKHGIQRGNIERPAGLARIQELRQRNRELKMKALGREA